MEKAASKALGIPLTPRSGAGEIHKADMKNKQLIVENKSSVRIDDKKNDYYAVIEKEWFSTLVQQANMAGLIPMLTLFVGNLGFVFEYNIVDEKPTEYFIDLTEKKTCKVYRKELQTEGVHHIIIKDDVWTWTRIIYK